MSLKAIQHSQYKKAGKTILTYKVSGTVAELEKYVEVCAAGIGKIPAEWMRSEDKDKAPLFFLSASNEIRFGRVPKASYTLDLKRDGSGYFINTQNDDMARWARIGANQELEMGKQLAARELGTVENTPVARPMVNNEPAVKEATDAEKMINEINNPLTKIAEVAAGNEGLEG